MTVLEALTNELPAGWLVTDVYFGKNWVVALVINDSGEQRAGVAAAHSQSPPESFQHCKLNEPANVVARRLLSEDLSEAAMALATLNAINQPADHLLTTDD